jgi:enoyl-CoA hydratase/carnithine racemase
MAEDVTFTVDEHGVGTLTLNRPHRLNAITREMVDLWRQVLLDASDNAEVRVIVVTGAGRAICAGGDADELIAFKDRGGLAFKDFLWRHVQRIALVLDSVEKPVIASLNGTARGAGLDMALMCDLRIAAESAIYSESYIHMGTIAGDGGTYFLPRLIGTARALELFWTGRDVSAAEALQLGFVNRVVADDQLATATLTLARQIAAQPQEAIRCFKRAVYQGMSMTLSAHLDMVSSHMAVLQGTTERRDRVQAFLDRKGRRS